MKPLKVALRNSKGRRAVVKRVLSHFGRDEIYPNHTSFSEVFQLDAGLYELLHWCGACNRELHRFFVVRVNAGGQHWATGVTDKGMEWICDQVDQSQGSPTSFIGVMPGDFWDPSFAAFEKVTFWERVKSAFR